MRRRTQRHKQVRRCCCCCCCCCCCNRYVHAHALCTQEQRLRRAAQRMLINQLRQQRQLVRQSHR
ncbi:MAG: hypothetical protein ACK4ZJ_19355, partial [Allorhizobium sp.]